MHPDLRGVRLGAEGGVVMRPDMFTPPAPTGNAEADLAAAEAHERDIQRLAGRIPEDEYCEAAAAAAKAVDEARLIVETAELERRLMEPLGDRYWRGLSAEEIDLAWQMRGPELCTQARRDAGSVRLPVSPEVVLSSIDTETARYLLAVLARPSSGAVWCALGSVARAGVADHEALIVRSDPQVAAVAGGRLVAVHGMAPPWGWSVSLAEETGWALVGDQLRWRGPGVFAALARLREAAPGPLLIHRVDLGAIGIHPAKGYVRLIWWAGNRRVELPVWGKALEQRLQDLMEVHAAGLAAEVPEAALWLPAVASLTHDRKRIRLTYTGGLRRGTRVPWAMLWSRRERGGDLSMPVEGPGITVVDSVEGACRHEVERTTVIVAELPATVRFRSGAQFLLRADPPAGAIDPAGALAPAEAREGPGHRQEILPEPRIMVRRGGGRLLPYGVVER